MNLRAVIFDVDGTLADTESTHLAAFNHAFAEAGLDWHWDVPLYTRLLDVSGGKERLAHYWNEVRAGVGVIDAGALADLLQRIHDLKTAAYESRVRLGEVALRPGVRELILSAHDAGLRLAIATTTSPVNVVALLRSAFGSDWERLFEVIEDASTAPRKKPDPQAYQQTLQRLGLPAAQALVIEDSANGLRAALGAGLATVITRNAFTAGHDFTGALRVLDDLQGVTIDDLQAWHAQAAH